jgi:hypothetical protein
MGLPRYLAMAGVDDLQRALRLGDELIARPDGLGGVALLQCGRESDVANELRGLLNKAGRYTVPLVVRSRDQAQSDAVLNKLENVTAVWVFADDLFATFMTVFATDLAFQLRTRARQGMPVLGIGGGSLALGGLLLANRICRNAQFDLVGGLGWAPRLLLDAGANRGVGDGAIARTTVRTLPGLLGVDLGMRGGLRVDGGRFESVGTEPIVLLGGDDGRLLKMSLEPGQATTLAPPPFAPFARGMLPAKTVNALSVDTRPARAEVRQAPPVASTTHTPPGSDRLCPMCKKVHKAEARVSIAV